MQLRARFIITPLVIFALLFLSGYLSVTYFPWAGGYKYDSAQWHGYTFAKINNIKNAAACDDYPDMLPVDKKFQAGCRAFFK